ncbi:MAG: peptidoglycan DD-metalloendopeptidase family protein [Bacteroidetes bacterium]|nr:peptidoglycan DD-metalloendopeptidase family protein [Bacteroidota bacterium]
MPFPRATAVTFAVRRRLAFTMRASSVCCLVVLTLVVATGSADARRAKKRAAPQRRHTSATHKERLSREAELAQLKREIAETERELGEHTRKENLTRKQLAAHNARTAALKKKLASLKSEAAALEAQEHQLDTSIQQTASTIDTLKRSYAADVVRRYTSGAYREHVTKGSGFDDPQEESVRLRNAYYAHLASTALHHNKETLDSTKSELTENREEVASLLDEQRGAISETKQQQQSAEQQTQRTAHELRSIQERKQALQKELDRRKAAAKRLEAMIANLAAKEEAEIKRRKEAIRKREAERRNKRRAGKKLTQSERHQEELDAQEQKSLAGPHSLGWPTASHRIVQGFGEQRNKELGTVTMNLGIDIGTAAGSAVHAAADGKVALVSSLPSYGTLVIIRHGGGVLTVYADLSGTSVSTGSTVTKGQTIGRSGSNSELGDILHFEVWKGKAKQNPVRWLK